MWQIAGILMSAIQLTLYITGLNHYKGKLEDLAGELSIWADSNRDKYLQFRGLDPDFYNYYETLPEYQICDSNVNRGKGASYYRYGNKLRRAIKTNRGYTPLVKVQLNTMLSIEAISQTGLNRTVAQIKEKGHVDNHILEKWSAIVSAPIGNERFQSGAVSNVISTSFKTLKMLGQGFNSAGAALGTQLFKVLN